MSHNTTVAVDRKLGTQTSRTFCGLRPELPSVMLTNWEQKPGWFPAKITFGRLSDVTIKGSRSVNG